MYVIIALARSRNLSEQMILKRIQSEIYDANNYMIFKTIKYFERAFEFPAISAIAWLWE